MTILASLARAYESLADRQEVPTFGYSRVSAGFCVVLAPNGRPAFPPINLRTLSGKKMIGRRLNLPSALVQRTSGAAPNFLWDKTAYALGITGVEGKQPMQEHAEFVKFHREALSSSDDAGLQAFLLFLESWHPESFAALGWSEDVKDENIVFGLEDSYRRSFLHDRPAAQDIWAEILRREAASEMTCLVTGEKGRIARSHLPIRGVWDAQSSGAYIVSYNASAFESYGKKGGDNAPVSEAAAFAYTTALNRFLERDSTNRIQIADASTVFWADAGEANAASAQAAAETEAIFKALLDEGWNEQDARRNASMEVEASQKVDEASESNRVGSVLQQIRGGRPGELKLGLQEHVRFHVLGLSPNAARLSVRFWLDDEFGAVARRYAEHVRDMALEPDRFGEGYSIQRMLKAATLHVCRERGGRLVWQRPRDAKPPSGLGGDILRAVLEGQAYPRTLLSQVVLRVRAERGRVTFVRAAICKAVLNRGSRLAGRKEDVPVALDRENTDAAYRLGRLFALLERSQKLALPELNATIRDRFFAGACAAPARLFPLLVKNGMHHLSAAQKDAKKRKLAFWLEGEIGQVYSEIAPNIPLSLKLDDQGRFQVGYFHQRFARTDKSGAVNPAAEASAAEEQKTMSNELSEEATP